MSQAHSLRDALSGHQGPRAIELLVAVEDPDLQKRLAAALDGDRFRLSSRPDDFSTASPPDVLITDQSLTSDTLRSFHERLMHGEVGVLLIGRALPADVVLPVDFTRRELRLSCRLLSQTVNMRRQLRKMSLLAASDPLTGLPNRRAIEDRYHEHARHAPAGLCLALVDLDRFKQINAELGYVAGDEVLRAAARTLAAHAQGRFVGRLGGDEFALVWLCRDGEDPQATVEELRRKLCRGASLKAERPLTASAGLAIASDAGAFVEHLARADEALRRAKEAGGKQTQMTPVLQSQ
jgi:diguanylate cyclase (GGDEF)-like protein